MKISFARKTFLWFLNGIKQKSINVLIRCGNSENTALKTLHYLCIWNLFLLHQFYKKPGTNLDNKKNAKWDIFNTEFFKKWTKLATLRFRNDLATPYNMIFLLLLKRTTLQNFSLQQMLAVYDVTAYVIKKLMCYESHKLFF